MTARVAPTWFGGTVVDDNGRERLRVFRTAHVIERLDAAIDALVEQLGGELGTGDTGRPS